MWQAQKSKPRTDTTERSEKTRSNTMKIPEIHAREIDGDGVSKDTIQRAEIPAKAVIGGVMIVRKLALRVYTPMFTADMPKSKDDGEVRDNIL